MCAVDVSLVENFKLKYLRFICTDITIDSGCVIEMSDDNILDPSAIFKINEH